ncbi:MAG: Gmad2 immunoglobulin-like domain-containing protein [Candidatus Cyclobacteriaceae bacterium M3_2C_046]
MKFTIPVLFLVLSLLISCNTSLQQENNSGQENNRIETPPTDQEFNNGPVQSINWKNYHNQDFNFSIEFPQAWQVAENNLSGPFPIINLYHNPQNLAFESPITVHADYSISFLSIFPYGYGTELPSGKQSSLDNYNGQIPLNVEVDPSESIVFLLENGTPWAYYLQPVSQPASWENGFLFAQIAIDEAEVTCYDEVSGEKIAMESCDPMTGDRIERTGQVNQQSARLVKNMMQSFNFSQTRNKQNAGQIKLEQPLPNKDISSPLTVKGKARGSWFFEGQFPVVLIDKDKNIIAEATAKARGKWMTDNFVPFEATLTYQNPPDDERGYLELKKSNPSGKPENSRTYSLPVLFPPQN